MTWWHARSAPTSRGQEVSMADTRLAPGSITRANGRVDKVTLYRFAVDRFILGTRAAVAMSDADAMRSGRFEPAA
jgi:hypothetical protein